MKNIHAALALPALLAIAGTAGAQNSNVTLYGSVGTQFVYATGVSNLKKLDPNSIVAPRLGVRGQEDLGGGLRAKFGLESGFNPSNGVVGTTFWNRGSWVGVDGDFGSLTLGRQWDLEDDYLCGLYVCGGYASLFNLPGFGNTSDLVNNAVKYTLPAMGGFAAGVMVAPGNGVTGRYTGAAATWQSGPWALGGSYDAQRNLAGQSDKLGVLAGKYSFGPGFVRAAWAESNPDASALGKATAYDVGVGWSPTSAASLSLDYVSMDRKNSPNGANFVRLVGIYNLSKRTSLNGNLIRLNNKGASAIGFAGATVNPGGSQTVVTAGIAHNF